MGGIEDFLLTHALLHSPLSCLSQQAARKRRAHAKTVAAPIRAPFRLFVHRGLFVLERSDVMPSISPIAKVRARKELLRVTALPMGSLDYKSVLLGHMVPER